jgi:hypothetical protein
VNPEGCLRPTVLSFSLWSPTFGIQGPVFPEPSRACPAPRQAPMTHLLLIRVESAGSNGEFCGQCSVSEAQYSQREIVAEERRGENRCDSPGDPDDIWKRSADVDTTILYNIGIPY